MNNRNLPCWCGSGKKYKKCHLHADEVFDEAMAVNKRIDRSKVKSNRGKLMALETIIQESMNYNYTGR
jgi:uncharacterized protein YecA (UPF0149 family)